MSNWWENNDHRGHVTQRLLRLNSTGYNSLCHWSQLNDSCSSSLLTTSSRALSTEYFPLRIYNWSIDTNKPPLTPGWPEEDYNSRCHSRLISFFLLRPSLLHVALIRILFSFTPHGKLSLQLASRSMTIVGQSDCSFSGSCNKFLFLLRCPICWLDAMAFFTSTYLCWWVT